MTSPADASTWWWPEDDAGVYIPAPPPPKRALRKQPHFDERQEKLIEKTTAKPVGPLIVSVSIAQQKIRVYDANGFFAESPVSTGTSTHTTPLGVFSIIQKNKWHRSNIYSGAPMPYMQRITWSGIALHAGVVPGYPASHGCIRMPNAFAMKMWGWTRMGARVIVTPGDITPVNFAHALLPAKRPALQDAPMASDPQKPGTGAKSDKAATLEPAGEQPAASAPELRASILHNDAPAAVKTADASGATASGAVVLSDTPSHAGASPAAAPAEPPAASLAKSEGVPEAAAGAEPAGEEPATTGTLKLAESKPGEPVAAENPLPSSDKAPAVQPAEKADGPTDSAAPGKDQSRASDPAPAPVAGLPAAKRGGGQIAAFVSAKDQKLYVRQNMTPLFDVPVTISAGERPLGTHIFTAEVARDDSVRWTVVSVPTPRRAAEQTNSRRGKNNLAAAVKPSLDSEGPAAALDRLSIPPEAMTRIAEAITSGSSLIVSDQGITASGETGQGTDFIIRLH